MNPTMVELVIDFVLLAPLAVFVGWFIRRKQRHRSAQAAAGAPVGIPCMLKRLSHSSRWRAGRLVINEEPLAWHASAGKQKAMLPGDLRRTAVRSPSLREWVSINPRSRIVEYESSDGDLLIAVLPEELGNVISALEHV